MATYDDGVTALKEVIDGVFVPSSDTPLMEETAKEIITDRFEKVDPQAKECIANTLTFIAETLNSARDLAESPEANPRKRGAPDDHPPLKRTHSVVVSTSTRSP